MEGLFIVVGVFLQLYIVNLHLLLHKRRTRKEDKERMIGLVILLAGTLFI